MSTTLIRRILYPKTSEIIADINETISLHQDIITNLEVLDKPDLTWQGMELDKLYKDFLSRLELTERISILEQKLNLLKEHMGTALNIVSARRMEVLEIVIILLIALSILQGLFTLH